VAFFLCISARTSFQCHGTYFVERPGSGPMVGDYDEGGGGTLRMDNMGGMKEEYI
jgi:hypothetical protein